MTAGPVAPPFENAVFPFFTGLSKNTGCRAGGRKDPPAAWWKGTLPGPDGNGEECFSRGNGRLEGIHEAVHPFPLPEKADAGKAGRLEP